MRSKILLAGIAAMALAGCSKAGGAGPSTSTADPGVRLPARKAGLWTQTMTEDGKVRLMGGLRICIDPATDAKLSVFGQKASKSACRRDIGRTPDGGWTFASVCQMGAGGTLSARGVARGDFGSRYRVHTDNTITGSRFPHMNGRHAVDLDYRYQGPCPHGMAPGQVSMENGWKVDLRRVGELARAIGGGA